MCLFSVLLGFYSLTILGVAGCASVCACVCLLPQSHGVHFIGPICKYSAKVSSITMSCCLLPGTSRSCPIKFVPLVIRSSRHSFQFESIWFQFNLVFHPSISCCMICCLFVVSNQRQIKHAPTVPMCRSAYKLQFSAVASRSPTWPGLAGPAYASIGIFCISFSSTFLLRFHKQTAQNLRIIYDCKACNSYANW